MPILDEDKQVERYVWLDIETGEFSRSWTQDEYPTLEPDKIAEDVNPDSKWKLIKYTCLTNENFEFNEMMKIK